MKKIIARVRGGLGNQLFILAAAYSAVLESDDYEIVLDTREYESYKVRDFELFNLLRDKRVRLYDSGKDFSLVYDISRVFYHIYQKVISPQKKMNKMLIKYGYLYTKRNADLQNVRINSDTMFLYGYFQDVRMTSLVKKSICSSIRDLYIGISLRTDVAYIAVSIRWGQDYLKQGWPICSKQYFEDGVQEIINEKYKNRKTCVLIFSDEMEDAKQLNFETEKVYVKDLSPSQQLLLMMKCQDFVISNSSFSWWGAFLGADDKSIVVAPNVWYDTKETTKETFLYYENMRIRDMGWSNI